MPEKIQDLNQWFRRFLFGAVGEPVRIFDAKPLRLQNQSAGCAGGPRLRRYLRRPTVKISDMLASDATHGTRSPGDLTRSSPFCALPPPPQITGAGVARSSA